LGPEIALLATLVGRLSKEEIAQVLTKRLRDITRGAPLMARPTMVLALLAVAGLIAIMANAQTTLAARAEPQSDLPGKKDMSTKRFDFRHFEAMPKDSRVPAAQAEVDRLFLPGSNADEFEAYFKSIRRKMLTWYRLLWAIRCMHLPYVRSKPCFHGLDCGCISGGAL
jgi:hypothetical protein